MSSPVTRGMRPSRIVTSVIGARTYRTNSKSKMRNTVEEQTHTEHVNEIETETKTKTTSEQEDDS